MKKLAVIWLIGLRYWRSRKGEGFASFIMFFSVTGITLGVAALILVTSIMNGLEGSQKKELLGSVPHMVLNTIKPIEQTQSQAWLDKLKQLEGVTQVVPWMEQQALLQSNHALEGVFLQGIDLSMQQDLFLEVNVVLGDLQDLRTPFSLILGDALAQKLHVSLGDTVRVLSSEGVVYTPMGLVPSTRAFKIVGIWSTNSSAGRFLALTNYVDAKRLARQPKNEVPQFRLYLQEPFALHQVKQAIDASFPQQFEIATWQRVFGQQFAAVKMEKRMMALLLSLIIIVAIFNIVSALVMMVHSKTADIAILKTLGMNSGTVRAIFMCQGMLSGLLGLLLGVGLGACITLNFDALVKIFHWFVLPPGMSIPIVMDPSQIIGVALGTLLITFLATWYPARRAASVFPAKVLRYE